MGNTIQTKALGALEFSLFLNQSKTNQNGAPGLAFALNDSLQ
ncbi:hypothetical protein [Bacillus benzoevorans]|nr:hypothetical protein [Bacillus benzoevorans]